jgi:hypothetical protein
MVDSARLATSPETGTVERLDAALYSRRTLFHIGGADVARCDQLIQDPPGHVDLAEPRLMKAVYVLLAEDIDGTFLCCYLRGGYP